MSERLTAEQEREIRAAYQDRLILSSLAKLNVYEHAVGPLLGEIDALRVKLRAYAQASAFIERDDDGTGWRAALDDLGWYQGPSYPTIEEAMDAWLEKGREGEDE